MRTARVLSANSQSSWHDACVWRPSGDSNKRAKLDGGANVASATTTANSVDDIRRSMAQIRQRMHQDMQGVVAGAEAASDWKHYVRLYPFAALGVALATGFLIVPRRRRSVSKTAEQAAEAVVAKLSGAANSAATSAETAAESIKSEAKAHPKATKGIVGAALTLAGSLALKYGQSYALAFVENWIAQQHQHQQATGPQPHSPPPQPPRSAASPRRPEA